MGGFFALSLRMARDAALLEFKKYVERNDPAVKLASRLSFLSKLACVNIPTSAIAAAINLYNPLLTPLTAMGAAYHALGLGVFLPSSTLNSNSDEGHKAREQIRGAGLKLPPYCGEDFDEIDAARREEDQGQPSIREEDQGQQDTSENEESEMSDAERRYYNNFVNLTDEQLANKAIELQRILGTLDTRMKQITDVRSNYNSFGQRQFDNGNKDPENLSRRQHESYFMLKGSYDIAFKKLNVINMLQDR
jgi:hypothetical protein